MVEKTSRTMPGFMAWSMMAGTTQIEVAPEKEAEIIQYAYFQWGECPEKETAECRPAIEKRISETYGVTPEQARLYTELGIQRWAEIYK
jgi:hypothetical protein